MGCDHRFGERIGASASYSESPDGSVELVVNRTCLKCGEIVPESNTAANVAALERKLRELGWTSAEIESFVGFPAFPEVDEGHKVRLRELARISEEISKVPGVSVVPAAWNPMADEFRIVIEVNGLTRTIGESEIDRWQEVIEAAKTASRVKPESSTP